MKFKDDNKVEGITITLEMGLEFKLIYINWRNDLNFSDGIQYSAQCYFKEEMSMPINKLGNHGLSSISVEKNFGLAVDSQTFFFFSKKEKNDRGN